MTNTPAETVERLQWPPSEEQLNEWLAQIVEVFWSASTANFIRAGKLRVEDIKAKYALREIMRPFAAALTAPAPSASVAGEAMREAAQCLVDRFPADMRYYAPGADEVAALRAALARLLEENEALRERVRHEIVNSPETADFMAGVPLEAAHQRERWGVDHDAGKSPFDWFWLVGYLAQKAADAAVRGDAEKALHHTISTGAALANWHAHISGADTRMRPGIDPARAALGGEMGK